MQVSCPHCLSALDIESVTALTEVLCTGCGASFRIDPAATAAWSPPAGQRKLGKFELLDAVGFGAFGTVYKARDPELDRIVAIKVPRSGNLATSDDLSRFVREARSVASLRHPAIVPVYEVGQVDSLPYLVSEFVQGMTLADLMTARRPTPAKAATLLAEIAAALQYAHDQGVVHRDVKPSNILLDDNERPHLMDFGLAKRAAGDITMTLEGQVLGTPAYMSPEQAGGEAHTVDGRGDVYSVGVILYQLLTGELPFKGNTRALLHQVQHDDAPPPRQLRKEVPRDLETICVKAMARAPERRYATAGALAEDLRRFVAGEPILARPPGLAERSLRWLKRHRGAVAGALGAVALSALVGTAVHLSRSERPIGDPGPPAVPTAPEPRAAQDVTPAAPLPALPVDLALAAQSSEGFLTLRVADLLAQEGVKRFEKELGLYEEANIPDRQTEIEKLLGVKPAAIERITIIPMQAGMDSVSLVTTRTPYKQDDLRAWLGPGARAETLGGKSCWLAAPPRHSAVHFLTERVFVLTDDKATLGAFLEAFLAAPSEDMTPGMRHRILVLADQRYQAHVALNLQSPPIKAALMAPGQSFAGAFGAPSPEESAKLRVFAKVELAALSFNLRSGTLAGDKLQLRVRLGLLESARGKLGKDNVRAAIAVVQKPLRGILESFAKAPAALETTDMGANLFKAMVQFYDQFALALDDVEVTVEETTVDVRLGDLALDLATLARMLGEQARQRAVKHGANLLQIGMALDAYVNEHQRLPPAALTAPDGKPLLSWRVALLPYAGQGDLHKKFKLDEPWDSPRNKPLLATMPPLFGGPHLNQTAYRAVTGPGTALAGTAGMPLSALAAGPDKTVMVVAAAEAVLWTQPQEIALAPDSSMPDLEGPLLFADGSVRRLKPGTDADALRALLSHKGGASATSPQLRAFDGGALARALGQAAVEVVRDKKSTSEQTSWALRLAERAFKLQPGDAEVLTALGLVQYRSARFPEALATLTRADEVAGKPRPINLAFLAMTHHRLGQHEPARALLQRLRKVATEPSHAADWKSQTFVSEAVTLVELKQGP